MRRAADRAYFHLCLALGRLLRAGRYATVHIVSADGTLEVRKQRRFYAPLLVWVGRALFRVLGTGVRVVAQRPWEEREQMVHRTLGRAPVTIGDSSTLVLPHLAGTTLATVLEDSLVEGPMRARAIELAVVALRDFHRRGLTHGDAMADNVMIDLEAGVAHWFDFETVHEHSRPFAWCRADDLRALLATCLLRVPPDELASTLHSILDVYADAETARLAAGGFESTSRRPLAFHLGQAGLSYRAFEEIGRLLSQRGRPSGVHS